MSIPANDTITKEQVCDRSECFQVSEIHMSGLNAAEAEPETEQKNAPITFAVLYKRNLSTLSAALILKRELGKKIRYGGLKDAKSMSWQFVSFQGTLPPIRRRNLSLTPLKTRFTHVSTREVWGNAFKIHLKNVEDPKTLAEEFLKLAKRPLPALFGPQRFGREEDDTHRIGLHILRKEYDEAVKLILKGKKGWYERIIEEALRGSKTSEEALRILPSELVRLFINAYQAHVFNKAILKFVSAASGLNKQKVLWAPIHPNGLPIIDKIQVAQLGENPERKLLVGMLPGTKLRKMVDVFSEIEVEVLAQDGLTPEDFRETLLGEFTGSPRRLYFEVIDPQYMFDRANRGFWLKFKLQRGMYASVVLSFLSKSLFHEYFHA